MRKGIIDLLEKYKEDLLLDSVNEYVEKICEKANIISYYEGDIVGFIAFYCDDSKKSTAFITMIIVEKNFQKVGVGKMLLDGAIQQLRQKKFESCQLKVLNYNQKAIDFYIRNGFKQIGIDNEFLIMNRNLSDL